MRVAFLYIVFSVCCFHAMASHIVGGEMTYSFLADTSIDGQIYDKYEIALNIYEDCKNGSVDAILQDNPAYLAIYDGAGNTILTDSFVFYNKFVYVPPNFNNSCVTNPPDVCVIKKTFKAIYYLAPNNNGYVVTYQRCCRNDKVVNILNPSSTGSTYFCTIPPASVGHNNSAVFTNYPPLIICVDNPLIYYNSATDADGDSLSYAFCESFNGANQTNVKPMATSPPYPTVSYVYPFTFQNPIVSSPQLAIDPASGLITGTPTEQGRYLISVCCIEWRHGVPIDTVRREFQFVVTNCTKKVVASMPQFSNEFNTYIVSCNTFTVYFQNNSIVGTPDSTFLWNFGVPGSTNDTSSAYQPSYTYPDTGVFIVTLVVNPHTDCTDSIWRYVKLYPYFSTDFYDSGILCPGAPVYFTDKTTGTILAANSWLWNFGDGATSVQQNPQHTYLYGGIYNTELVSNNKEGCTDTVAKQIVVDNFKPFAGVDTIILKGQSVNLTAGGGSKYIWRPAYQLNDTTSANPIGYYPDTGTFTYSVFVMSDYGCSGYDTVIVKVVNQGAFFMPTAFTPSQTGVNSIFRPIAIGYSALNYLRVFNRWGEQVYFGNSLQEGDGWNGTYKNQPAEMGVYFWEVQYTDRNGRTGTAKGDVTLIR